MLNILVVEDSKLIQHMIQKALSSADFNVLVATTFEEARNITESNKDIFLAILDLTLPDTKDDEIVDFMLDIEIPSIVYSGSYDYSKVEQLMSKPIIDYVIKNSDNDIEYIVDLAKKLERYRGLNALIVDDSNVTLTMLKDYIQPLGFNILTAKNGQEALEIAEENPISLMITDYNMPVMDGFELVQKIRKKYKKEDLKIISVTSSDSIEISTKMLKFGANAFLRKPYSKDELNSIINNLIASLFSEKENIQYRKDLTNLIRQIKIDNLENTKAKNLNEKKIRRAKTRK